MTATTSTFTVEAIPPAQLGQIRAAGRDESGIQLVVRTDSDGDPLRCCLRPSRAGERVFLIAYSPPGTAGAYAERGPVFIHAEPCDGYRTPDRYPPELAGSRRVVRAYNGEGGIADGALAEDGQHAETIISEFLGRPGVEIVHVRAVEYGCFTFAVRRA